MTSAPGTAPAPGITMQGAAQSNIETDSPTPAIHVQGLSHAYIRPEPKRSKRKSHKGPPPAYLADPALSDINFTVNPGEVFGLLGPNGSGKSTLFRILATVQAQRPAHGEKPGRAAIFGHDLAQQPAQVRGQIGVVFQHPALDDKLTARENLRFHGMLFGLGQSELATRGEQWLETLGLTDRADDPIESFSGGMRRRVEIAKALLTDPRLLMMDEASTGLDAGVLRDIWGLLRERVDTGGLTIALTTHLMHEAEQCDRLAVLSKGKIVAIDTPAGLVDRVGGRVLEVQFAEGGGKASPEDEQALRDTLGRLAPGQALEITLFHGSARIEHQQADQWVGPLMEAMGDRLRAVRVGRPTLEDAYLKLTGHRLGSEEISD